MGCAILPHLRNLVEIIEHGLVDEQQKVRTITALAIAALAEAATPYGKYSFKMCSPRVASQGYITYLNKF